MKKGLLFMLSLCSVAAMGQSIWTKGNPVWHYDYFNVAEQGFIKIEKQDSVLHNGQWCDHLVATKFRFFQSGPPPSPTTYTTENYVGGDVYVSNDTVFYWDVDHFSVLYQFNGNVGDTWLFRHGLNEQPEFQCNDTSIAIVQGVGTINLNGENVPQLEVVNPANNGFHLKGQVNARFGAMGNNYLFPLLNNCDSNTIVDFDIISFKCFSDDSLYYNPSGEDCEYLLTHLSLNEATVSTVMAYPSPVEDWLLLQGESQASKVVFFDLNGKSYQVEKNEQNGYDLRGLSKGMYIAVVEMYNGSKQSLKVIKR